MASAQGSKAFATKAGSDGTWRQTLPAVPASKQPFNFTFASSNSTAERAAIVDVLFGDVYICGGQARQLDSNLTLHSCAVL